jgi:hypothetical protein
MPISNNAAVRMLFLGKIGNTSLLQRVTGRDRADVKNSAHWQNTYVKKQIFGYN